MKKHREEGQEPPEEREITWRSLEKERAYGIYWYSALWRVLRPIMVGLTVAVVVAGLGMGLWNRVYESVAAPVDRADESEVFFEITSGQSLTRVSRNLEEAGLIRSRTVFKYYCDFAGMGQKLQIGQYALKRSMNMTEIADMLTTGDGNPLVRNITLIPGETIEDFADKMVRDGVIADRNAFLTLCKTGEAFREYYYVADVLATKNAADRKYVLEGYLAPDTYEIYVTATAEDIIRKLLSQTEAVFPAEMQEQAKQMGMTMDQVLTLASLIEKEAGADDFAKVSAVFHNRLKAKMKLQSDVTIHYVTGVRKMALEGADLSVNSFYNTYVNEGLPIGPICNPSAAAIRAALNPDPTFTAENYLYFCAKDPEHGGLYFSRTLAEHEQAVAIYAPLWKQFDQKRGIV
ncbi:MAG: endolytic transglycosylase MltG [Clostridia bacterium]|nr:endolytic transglycosylase MltG [Clostridia bacterium]